MGMMDSIAATATSLSAAQFQQNYSLSLMKKAMNTQELAAQQMLQSSLGASAAEAVSC